MKENWVFLKRWLNSPTRLGTSFPVTDKLAAMTAGFIRSYNPKTILELGAGTGSITQAILDTGHDINNITVLELDSELCDFLRKRFPEMRVVCANALDVSKIFPKNSFDIIICSVPFMYLKEKDRETIVRESIHVLSKKGHFLHLTYYWQSPLEQNKQIQQKLIAKTYFNIPPGFLWEYNVKN